MKKQNKTDSFIFQPNVKELQVNINKLMDPQQQQDREETLARFGRTMLGSCYQWTSRQPTREKIVVLVMQVHVSRAQSMRAFLRPFEDVVVQSSTLTPDQITLAPLGTGLLTILLDKEVKLGSKIKALGQALNLSNAELAMVMGVSPKTVYNWTRNSDKQVKHPNKIKNLTALAIIAMQSPTMDIPSQGAES